MAGKRWKECMIDVFDLINQLSIWKIGAGNFSFYIFFFLLSQTLSKEYWEGLLSKAESVHIQVNWYILSVIFVDTFLGSNLWAV